MHRIFTVVCEGRSTCGHVDRTAIILRSQNKWKTTMGDWQCGRRVRL